MIRILAIDHVVLRTDRLDDMVDFYCNTLGCRIERTLPDDIGLTQLRAGNALIDLVRVDSQLGRRGGPAPTGQGINMDHLCLEIEPFDESELLEYLEQRKVQNSGFETRYGSGGYGRSIYVTDPDGNIVELRSRVTQPNSINTS